MKLQQQFYEKFTSDKKIGLKKKQSRFFLMPIFVCFFEESCISYSRKIE